MIKAVAEHYPWFQRRSWACFRRESETWQCLMCTNVLNNEIAASKPHKSGEKRALALSLAEQQMAERILLELYCQNDYSVPFREVVPLEVRLSVFTCRGLY